MDFRIFGVLVILVFSYSCNGQTQSQSGIEPLLVMKTIVEEILKLKAIIEGQEAKLMSIKESQTAFHEKLKGQEGKITIIEELQQKLISMEVTQKYIEGSLQAQHEESKKCATQDQLKTIQSISALGQEKIITLLDQSSISSQEFQIMLVTDECLSESHNCSAWATCTDILVLYKCDCQAGYKGDGFTCTDIDECAEDDFLCGANELCVNKPGSYNCTCQDGYEHGPSGCQDIDECLNGIHQCDPPSLCSNVNGSYGCQGIPCENPSLMLSDLGCITPILTRVNWSEARDRCASSGSRLLEDIKEKHLGPLSAHFRPMMSTRPYPWVGFKEGNWTTSGLPVSADVVAKGEVVLEGGCGNVDLRDKTLGLWDGVCRVKDYALCQSIPKLK